MIIPFDFFGMGSFTILSRKTSPLPHPPPTELPGCHERLLRSPVAGPARRGGGPGAVEVVEGRCGRLKWLKSPSVGLIFEEDGKK